MSSPSAGAASALWRAALGGPSLLGTDPVPVQDAAGRVTAGPVLARLSAPAVPCSAMDGIAVTAADTASGSVAAGCFEVVDTGDPLPPGRDAVVMREHLRRRPDGTVTLPGPVPAGQHVRPVGESVRAGAELVAAGRVLRPADLAAAATGGHRTLDVRRRPVVTIVPTGDEVRPLGSDLAPGELLDTNSIMLAATLRTWGADVRVTAIQPDVPDRISDTVGTAARSCDLVLVLAGSSAGRDDHTAGVVRGLGAVVVHGVAMRPGHPVLLGVLQDGGSVPVVGVPGYPAAAALAVELFALPLLADLQGRCPERRPSVAARLCSAVPSRPGVEEYVLVALPGDGTAVPLARGAGSQTALSRADAVLRIDAGCAGHEDGETVVVQPVERPGWAGAGPVVEHDGRLAV
ncbi:molybdopterin molybdotransferase MoeA [Pseudonocardia abyssalis]|uniref:Molybdopterin molybdenumtransferase n=1 Tax=Pseudonocardia abyssalis TaxID=2792008 RepID=A0ABS6UTD3_9PSEU|nr:molybdopterin molybdotransferase MoeA [Pseudonocardia abyssalis]MBW0116822.1 molybdopterin molybdotransferase MoeA [Pseudonocardia abyssalis]MBW0135517.1 molybdopterin molybdotransferase MoeA [Pseudonocardia abyssalis]